MLVSPAPPGSAFPVAILNDQLSIRAAMGPSSAVGTAVAPQAGQAVAVPAAAPPLMMQSTPVPAGGAPIPSPNMATASPQQVEMTNQLMAACPGPSAELTFKCLEESAWNYQAALASMQNFIARGGMTGMR